MVMAFASSGSSTRQREASWAGLLPPDMQELILQQLLVGTVGEGIGGGSEQFKTVSSMFQDSLGSDSTVWAVTFMVTVCTTSSRAVS